MKRLALLLLMATAACGGDDPVAVDGSCAVGVFANDVFYAPLDELLAESAVSEEPAFQITRYDPECYDQGEPHTPVNGESNFLDVGTPIHRVLGFGPLEQLAYFDQDAEGWRPLVAVQGCEGDAAGTAAPAGVEPDEPYGG